MSDARERIAQIIEAQAPVMTNGVSRAIADAHRLPAPLCATGQQIASMLHTARTMIDGAHPAYGNHLADVLDALVAYHEAGDADAAYEAAEELLDTATRLRDRADAVRGEWVA